MDSAATSYNHRPVDQYLLEELRRVAGTGPVLILTHDNPDPDALASGEALGALLSQAWDIPVRLVYSGIIARAENKAMLYHLTPEWELVNTLEGLEAYSALAMVDTQPGAGNNSLPPGILPHIVIDHHYPVRKELDQVPFVDIRPEIGATASMVYQYLECAGVQPDQKLATALFYGIQADTRGLSRGGSLVDQDVYIKLLSRIDRTALIQVEQAGLPRDYFRAFSRGLQASRLYGRVVLAWLDEMHRPDFTAEMADLLIRLDGAAAALCLGTHQNLLYLSLRTETGGKDAGLLVQQVILPPGKAGGHGTMAGGQVPLSAGQDYRAAAQEIEKRFLDLVGETSEGVPLLA